MKKENFKYKIFTSFILFVTFLVTTFSGIVLFISPPGRVANWTNWAVLGFTKHEWSAFHIVFVTIFLIASIFHLFYFNWGLFWSYIKQKSQRGIKFKKEFSAAFAVLIILLIGVAAKVPPIISIVDLSEKITNSWENQNEGIAPPLLSAL